jgi:hypothetical protein
MFSSDPENLTMPITGLTNIKIVIQHFSLRNESMPLNYPLFLICLRLIYQSMHPQPMYLKQGGVFLSSNVDSVN